VRALENTGVVVAANLFGYPLDWGLIRTLADEVGSVVVEDAAQGIGTMWGERMGGSQAELSVLSFGRGKGWTGSGGGALLLRGSFASADPPALLPPPSSVASMATRALAQWILARPALYGIPAHMPGLGLGETHFREPTRPAAMHPYQARLVARSEAAATAEISFRRARAAVLRDLLSDRAGVTLPEPVAHGEASYLRFALRSPKLPAALPARVRRLGGYRGYPRVLPELPQLLRLAGDAVPSVPGARRLVAELLTLPVHSRTPPSGLDRRQVSVFEEILDS
jgi:dTDP-4-amino-4,6-dideoxygalactose transaminase